MANNADNADIMKRFLMVLDMFFSTDKVKIDTTTFNAARVCKLYGTFSRKGSDTAERPQRESKILKVPEEVKVNAKDYFVKVADLYPNDKETRSYHQQSSGQQFDIDEFISKHGIGVTNDNVVNGIRKIIFKECPFDHSHKNSGILQLPNGALVFKCFHNSCSQYTFKDFRMHFEPDAYTRNEYDRHIYRKRFNNPELYTPQKVVVIEESEERGNKLLSFAGIGDLDLTKIEAIPTGIDEIDRRIKGLVLGQVSLISGTNGSGKSTWINNLVLNAAQTCYKSMIFSGELPAELVKQWIMLPAAGREWIDDINGFYRVKPQIKPLIERWLDDKVFIYNNNYGNRYEQILTDIETLCPQKDVRLIVLDNLMSMDITGALGDRNDQQKSFIQKVVELAKRNKVHIIVVAHPRKEAGFLRKESISGTADLTNGSDNVFIIHRVNDDFNRRATEFYPQARAAALADYDNVVEICKNRLFGAMDITAGLYYEIESRRLKNSRGECLHYGWQREAGIGGEIKQLSTFEDDYHYGEDVKFGLPY
jgi:archaellum biogenesis ATPase FlaH